MLRISEVWRIRQIKFQKQSKKCKHFISFFEILLGSEQLHVKKRRRVMSRVLVIGCGGVASVAIQKCCQADEVFTELWDEYSGKFTFGTLYFFA